MKSPRAFLTAGILFTLISVSECAGGSSQYSYGGAIVSGKETLVSLTAPNGRSRWCQIGDYFDELELMEIRPDLSEVVLTDATGNRIVLPMKWAVIKESKMPRLPDTLIPLENLNWAWIKSSANPMRREPETIPEWAYRNWNTLEEGAKVELKNYYRLHGWDIQPRVVEPGRIQVRNTRLENPADPRPTIEELRKMGKSASKQTTQNKR